MFTTDEFYEFIKQFNKQKGEYTLDELLEIGTRFKELPRKDRKWNDLHTFLGITEFSADAYRKRVEKHIKACDLIDQISSVEGSNEEGNLYRETYIEKQKVRDWYNAYRRDIREETRIQNLKDELRAAADKFSKLSVLTIRSSENKAAAGVEAVLLLSDLHIGADCDNYYNVYNLDVAKARLTKLATTVRTYCANNHVETLHVLNLGDLIHGIIHTNARIEAQMDVAEQIMTAGELVSQFLATIQLAAPKITYRSVFDNHSRAIADKNQHIEKEQFSRVIDWYIQERLKDTDVEFIENDIDGGIGRFKLRSGKTLMFCHGHNDGRNNSFQNFVGLTREWVDYICIAHYHNPAAKEYQGCKVFVNGSIVGTESYAFGRRLFARPSQKLLIFNSWNDDIQDIDIALNCNG